MTIEEKIKQFLIDEPDISQDVTDISLDEPLIENGIIDSMIILKLIAFIEDAFDITLSDEDITAENFATIQQIKTLVQSLAK